MNSEENKYSLMLVDVSYLLTRNLWVSTKSKSINEFNAGDVLRLTIQTLNNNLFELIIFLYKHQLVSSN